LHFATFEKDEGQWCSTNNNSNNNNAEEEEEEMFMYINFKLIAAE